MSFTEGMACAGYTMPMRMISAVLVLLLFSSQVQAHTFGQTYSAWRIDGTQVQAVFNLPLDSVASLSADLPRDDQSAPGTNSLSDIEILTRHIHEGTYPLEGCDLLTGPEAQVLDRAGFVQIRWQWHCVRPQGAVLAAIFPLDPQHVHTVRVVKDGKLIKEDMVDARSSKVSFAIEELQPEGVDTLSIIQRYLQIGVLHILSGPDHLVFLLALLSIASLRYGVRMSQLIWLITGFTAGHSLSLVSTALDLVKPDAGLVEALIGYTILLVVLEYFLSQKSLGGVIVAVLVGCAFGALMIPSPLTWLGLGLFSVCYLLAVAKLGGFNRLIHLWLTVGFGLIHGFGFAGSLLDIGLPLERRLPALLGFNLGIELGQLIVLVPAVFLLRGGTQLLSVAGSPAESAMKIRMTAADLLAGVCAAGGCYWFVSRLLTG